MAGITLSLVMLFLFLVGQGGAIMEAGGGGLEVDSSNDRKEWSVQG